jgi:hypothetical protein
MASNSDLFGTGMMRFSEKQMLKKILDVIEIPSLWHLDFELKLDMEFYARFLALYVAKIKRDWVRIDEEFSGKGPKKYFGEFWTKRVLKIDANYRRALKKYEKHPEIFEPGFEEVTQNLMRNFEKRARKKCKKKSFKLWKNCIPLSEY